MIKFILIVVIVLIIGYFFLNRSGKQKEVVYGRDIGKTNVYNDSFNTWNFKVSAGFANTIMKLNNANDYYTNNVFIATREIYNKINDEIFDKYKDPAYVPDTAKKKWFETKVDPSKFFGCENYLEVVDLHSAAVIRELQIDK